MNLCESALVAMKDKQSCQKIYLSTAVRDEVERVYMDVASDHRRGRYPGLKRVTNSMVVETLVVEGLRAIGHRDNGDTGAALKDALVGISDGLNDTAKRLTTVVKQM